jgi:primosomal protein N' (replication factor Y)
MGTERVENALKKIFPDSRVVRMDMDTVSSKGRAEEILGKFRQGKYDILVGTQIVAKGWDFSDVELVGVISSDASLMKPDFRAAEKTYSLLKQLEGKAGKGESPGKIIIQTFNPSHYSIRMLLERDYRRFYDQELDIRKEAEFPPFSKLINIVSSHKNENTAKKNMLYCKEFIEEKIKDASMLGPSPAPRYKVRGNYRWQILIKHNQEERTKKYLREMMESRSFSGKLKVDVDPQEML